MSNRKNICILGDPSLVGEYTALCTEKGFEVQPFDESNRVVDLVLELTNLSIDTKKNNLTTLDERIPPSIPILSSSVTFTVAEQSTWMKHPERLIGIGAFPTMLQGSVMECVAGNRTDSSTRSSAELFATALGKEAIFVQDSVGHVMPRILSTLVNEACFAMAEGVAAGTDIDTAMKLGTNYPQGPLEWGERVGAKHILAVMESLHKQGGERYRPAPLLQKAALRNSFAGN